MNPPTPLRVGIIGAGAIASRHFEGYALAGAQLMGFAEVSDATRERRALEWKAPGFASFEELLETVPLDAVSICTPNAYHAPAALAAMRRGIHVLCEKPLSLDLAACDELVRVSHEMGVVLQTGHHLRASPPAVTAKRLIDEGRVGRVTFMRFRQAHDWGGAPEVRGAFGSLAASGGGTLLDNGCHMMDLARHFGGEVRSVFTRMATLKFDIEVEDTAVTSLEFESGALASVESAWTATGWEEAFWVYGTQGALECTNRLGAARLRFANREFGYSAWGQTDETWYDFANVSNAHAREVVKFVESIQTGAPVICTGEDGRESVRLVLAGYESARTGQAVQMVAETVGSEL